eukprot:ctg_220.g160
MPGDRVADLSDSAILASVRLPQRRECCLETSPASALHTGGVDCPRAVHVASCTGEWRAGGTVGIDIARSGPRRSNARVGTLHRRRRSRLRAGQRFGGVRVGERVGGGGARCSGHGTAAALHPGPRQPDGVPSGSVQVWGRCVEAYAPRQLRGQLVGYVSQQPTLASLRASRASGGERGDSEQGRLSLQAVWQFILAQRRKQGDQLTQVATRAALETPVAIGTLSSDDYQRRLDETLRVAKVDPVLLDRPLSALSGGERSRVALARALLLQPRILVLDEVTSSLDGATAAQVLRNLDEWKERTGSTLVIVTHRLAEVTRGKLLMILGGRVVLTGDAQTLLNDPQQGNDIRPGIASLPHVSGCERDCSSRGRRRRGGATRQRPSGADAGFRRPIDAGDPMAAGGPGDGYCLGGRAHCGAASDVLGAPLLHTAHRDDPRQRHEHHRAASGATPSGGRRPREGDRGAALPGRFAAAGHRARTARLGALRAHPGGEQHAHRRAGVTAGHDDRPDPRQRLHRHRCTLPNYGHVYDHFGQHAIVLHPGGAHLRKVFRQSRMAAPPRTLRARENMIEGEIVRP